MKNIPGYSIRDLGVLPIKSFIEMDYASIEKFNYPIELMMENAGLQLARLVAAFADKSSVIQIGIGKGNNGGGGMVAARRLMAWGYKVNIHLPEKPVKDLLVRQYYRLQLLEVNEQWKANPDIFVDAYFGFSQRLPLPGKYVDALLEMNRSTALKISLDLPSAFYAGSKDWLFFPNHLLTLAAMKTELLPYVDEMQIWVADLGLPEKIYQDFGITQPGGFASHGFVRVLGESK